MIERSRETRHVVCAVAVRATAIAHRASPLEAGVSLRVLLEETCELAAHDVNRELTAFGEGQLRERRPRCSARSCERPPSTVAEHTPRAVRDDLNANAPGRIEGRCEHLDLPVAHVRDSRDGALLEADRLIERRRDDRHGVRAVAARASAIARRASPLEAGVSLRVLLEETRTVAVCGAQAGELLRVLLEQTRELAARDVIRELTACGEGQLRELRRPMHAHSCERPPSTVAEHLPRAVRDDVNANAPGRIEGRREHFDLPIGHDATVATALCSRPTA